MNTLQSSLYVVAIVSCLLCAFVVGGNADALPGVLAIGSMGAGAVAFNALRLPRWARLRERQMQQVAERTLALLGPTRSG